MKYTPIEQRRRLQYLLQMRALLKPFTQLSWDIATMEKRFKLDDIDLEDDDRYNLAVETLHDLIQTGVNLSDKTRIIVEKEIKQEVTHERKSGADKVLGRRGSLEVL